jgi:hypothetical protein
MSDENCATANAFSALSHIIFLRRSARTWDRCLVPDLAISGWKVPQGGKEVFLTSVESFCDLLWYFEICPQLQLPSSLRQFCTSLPLSHRLSIFDRSLVDQCQTGASLTHPSALQPHEYAIFHPTAVGEKKIAYRSSEFMNTPSSQSLSLQPGQPCPRVPAKRRPRLSAGSQALPEIFVGVPRPGSAAQMHVLKRTSSATKIRNALSTD